MILSGSSSIHHCYNRSTIHNIIMPNITNTITYCSLTSHHYHHPPLKPLLPPPPLRPPHRARTLLYQATITITTITINPCFSIPPLHSHLPPLAPAMAQAPAAAPSNTNTRRSTSKLTLPQSPASTSMPCRLSRHLLRNLYQPLQRRHQYLSCRANYRCHSYHNHLSRTTISTTRTRY